MIITQTPFRMSFFGGGGFLLFYVSPEYQDAVKRAMSGLLHIPFTFENGGTKVLYYAPEEYHS